MFLVSLAVCMCETSVSLSPHRPKLIRLDGVFVKLSFPPNNPECRLRLACSFQVEDWVLGGQKLGKYVSYPPTRPLDKTLRP